MFQALCQRSAVFGLNENAQQVSDLRVGVCIRPRAECV